MKLKYFLPAIMWGLFILIISLVPASKIPPIPILQLKFADKIIHFIMYFVFAAFVSIGFYLQSKSATKKNYFISFIIPFFFASSTEIMQQLLISGRAGDFYDLLANIAGIFIGILVARAFSKTMIFERVLRPAKKMKS